MTPSQLAAALGLPQQTSQATQASILPGNQSFVPAATRTTPIPSPTVAPYQATGGGPGGGNSATFLPASTGTQYTTTPGNPAASVGAGGPGGTGGTAAPLAQNGTDPTDWHFTNNDTQYSGRDLETMLNDPYAFQKEYLKSIGLDTPGANAALGQYASRLNPLSFVLGAANMSPNQQSDLEDLAKQYEGLISQYTTPGGRMPEVGEIMNILLGTGDIPSGGTASNLLQSILVGQDPQGQTQSVNQILGAALAGMPGMWGNAWANMLDQQGAAYQNSTMDAYGGPAGTYLSYLRNDPFMSSIPGR